MVETNGILDPMLSLTMTYSSLLYQHLDGSRSIIHQDFREADMAVTRLGEIRSVLSPQVGVPLENKKDPSDSTLTRLYEPSEWISILIDGTTRRFPNNSLHPSDQFIKSNTPTVSTRPKSDSSSADKGAIAGGLVGGVVGLAVLAGLLLLYRGWLHSKQQDQLSSTDGAPLTDAQT
ncbi:MAG: hypothetical protein Q9170_006402 [Blastenia crenularia]